MVIPTRCQGRIKAVAPALFVHYFYTVSVLINTRIVFKQFLSSILKMDIVRPW